MAGHLLLQLPDVVTVAHLQLSAVEGVGDVDQQLAHAERLDDVAVGSRLEGGLDEPGVVGGGDHHGRRAKTLGGDVLQQIDAGLPGHPDVDEDGGEVLLIQALPGLGGVGGGVADVSAGLEHPDEKLADQRVVVDDEDAAPGPGGIRPRSGTPVLSRHREAPIPP